MDKLRNNTLGPKSSYKTISGTLPWVNKKQWILPASDKHRMDRCFRDGPGDLDTAIPMLMPYLKSKRVCVQAGGCHGVWPIRLSQIFEQVITFEPEPVNYNCLLQNIDGYKNIRVYNNALWNEHVNVSMILDKHEIGNTGAYRIDLHPSSEKSIETIRIDDLTLEDVDLIYLDIEGAEYKALLGAMDTIKKYYPVIGIEHKGHSKKYGDDPIDLLYSLGYKCIGRPFSLDIIFHHINDI